MRRIASSRPRVIAYRCTAIAIALVDFVLVSSPLAGRVIAGETSAKDTAEGILLEAEHFDARSPNDGTFGRETSSPEAHGGKALSGFFLKGGRCTYRFDIREAGIYQVWVRYASNKDQQLHFAIDSPQADDISRAERASLTGTGALSGQDAWRWAKLKDIRLNAGQHELTFYAAPLRLDCIWISRENPPPSRDEIRNKRLQQVRGHLANPLEPIAPEWLAEADDYVLPDWYDKIRVCAHTRLSWSCPTSRPPGSTFSIPFTEASRLVCETACRWESSTTASWNKAVWRDTACCWSRRRNI